MIIKADKYTVLIDDNTMTEIVSVQKGDHKKECGGIILGSITNDYRIIIRGIPKATKDKKTSKYSCTIDKRVAQTIINDAFQKTVGSVTYIGEWHTHPVDNPTFSHQDKETIKDQFLSNITATDFILMLIIGKVYIELSIYTNNKLSSTSKKIQT